MSVGNTVVVLVVGICGLYGLGLAWNAITAEDPPLLLTPADVDGEWPFAADAVRVSCCQDGHIGIVADNGQYYYWFAGARHTDRFPVTTLGRPGATMDDFGTAYVAARTKAVERWPELVGVSPVR